MCGDGSRKLRCGMQEDVGAVADPDALATGGVPAGGGAGGDAEGDALGRPGRYVPPPTAAFLPSFPFSFLPSFISACPAGCGHGESGPSAGSSGPAHACSVVVVLVVHGVLISWACQQITPVGV